MFKHRIDKLPEPGPSGQNHPSRWRSFLKKGRIVNNTWIPEDGIIIRDLWNSSIPIECFEHREKKSNFTNIYMIGDSRVRFLYERLMNLLTNSTQDYGLGKNQDHSFNVTRRTKILYKADNYLNKLSDFMKTMLGDVNTSKPSFIFLQTGMWFLRWNTTDDFIKAVENARDVIAGLSDTMKDTEIIWIYHDRVQPEDKRIKPYESWHEPAVMELNRITDSIFTNSSVSIWKSGRELASMVDDWKDPIHVGTCSDDEKANLMMNFICEKYMYTHWLSFYIHRKYRHNCPTNTFKNMMG